MCALVFVRRVSRVCWPSCPSAVGRCGAPGGVACPFQVFFFPASYRRAYQIEQTDNANILLRAEVLNKLNNKRNPIIVTYSEALSEKVISKLELKKIMIGHQMR